MQAVPVVELELAALEAMSREATVLDRDRDGGVECRLALSQRPSMQLFPVWMRLCGYDVSGYHRLS